MRSGGAIPPPPPKKGYLSDTCAIPFENKATGCDTPLCDTLSKGYCAIGGGISHWAAKHCPQVLFFLIKAWDTPGKEKIAKWPSAPAGVLEGGSFFTYSSSFFAYS